jgi:DNA-binding CsgD family transcriptional regulator
MFKIANPDELIRNYYDQGKTNSEIAGLLECTPNSISYRLRKMGIMFPNKSKYLPLKYRNDYHIPDLKEKIISDYIRGESSKIIAKKYNTTHRTVLNYLIKADIERRPAEGVSIYSANHDFFKYINTFAKAYSLGFITADGCIEENAYRVSIGIIKSDESILQYIKNSIEYTGPLTYTVCEDEEYGVRYSVRLRISSRRMLYDLENWGIGPRKSFDVPWIEGLDDKLMPAYILGLFDGDGCWSFTNNNGIKSPNFSICSASPDYMSGLSLYIQDKLALPEPNIQYVGESDCLQFRYGGIEKSRLFFNYLYQNCEFCLLRKYNRAKEMLGL